jgi:ribose/xylose/arabinose/galactoside ABC-type transport system permease subunit
MKRWVLPVLLLVEIGIFTALSGVGLDSTGAVWTYFKGYFADLLAQAAPALLLATGMTLVISTAGIDLSVASMAALSACVVSLFPEGTHFWFTAVPLGLMVGVLAGTMNGLLIGRLDVPPIIATLGTMILFRGLCFAIMGEAERSPFLSVPGYEHLGEFSGSMALVLVACGGFGFWFHRSRWRREILMMGGNRVAARYAGIPVTRRICEVYALMGFFAALAALTFTSRNGSVSASSLTGMELRVIVAVVLGGTRVQGGMASLTGTVFGVLVLAVLDEGLRGASKWGEDHLPFKLSHLQYLILGGLLLVGVALGTRSNKR